MTPRFQFAVTILVLSAFTFGCAQTPPAKPKTQAPKVQSPPAKLPQIVTNPKMSVSQNAAQLLLNTAVQADLQLSKDTKASLLKIYGDYDAKYQELTKGATGSDALEAQIDDLTTSAATKAIAVLNSDQVTRLNQLGLQAMALDAFRLSEVRTKLGLTADQSTQFDKTFADLDAKQEAFDNELGERISKLGDPGTTSTNEENAEFRKKQKAILDDMEPRSKAIEDLRKSDVDVLVGLLDPNQKATWQKMTGAPLKGS